MSSPPTWPVRQSVLAICARANDPLTLVCVLRWIITQVRIIHDGTLQQSATEQSKTAIDHESEAPESTTTASSADEVGPTEKHDEDGEDNDDEDDKKHRKVKSDDDDDDDQALYEDTDDTVRQGQEVTQAISRVTDTAIFASITLPHLQFISFSFRYVIL
jgi:hypothetical protein